MFLNSCSTWNISITLIPCGYKTSIDMTVVITTFSSDNLSLYGQDGDDNLYL